MAAALAARLQAAGPSGAGPSTDWAAPPAQDASTAHPTGRLAELLTLARASLAAGRLAAAQELLDEAARLAPPASPAADQVDAMRAALARASASIGVPSRPWRTARARLLLAAVATGLTLAVAIMALAPTIWPVPSTVETPPASPAIPTLPAALLVPGVPSARVVVESVPTLSADPAVVAARSWQQLEARLDGGLASADPRAAADLVRTFLNGIDAASPLAGPAKSRLRGLQEVLGQRALASGDLAGARDRLREAAALGAASPELAATLAALDQWFTGDAAYARQDWSAAEAAFCGLAEQRPALGDAAAKCEAVRVEVAKTWTPAPVTERANTAAGGGRSAGPGTGSSGAVAPSGPAAPRSAPAPAPAPAPPPPSAPPPPGPKPPLNTPTPSRGR
jgi:hypothetical protein